MKKRIVCLFLAVLMVLGSVSLLASCGEEECTNHVDANHDGKCDTEGCTQTLPVKHEDKNEDGKCDGCGKTMETTEEEECEHEDEDYDGYCDICDEEVEIEICEHEDENEDGYCDLCDEEMNEGEEEEIISYPWESQSLIFQMTHNTNENQLPSACERYLAGEDDSVSEGIDNKVRDRNNLATYYTGVTVKYLYYDDTPEYKWGQCVNLIESTVTSGTTKEAPDMYCNFVYDLVGASLKNCFANLRGTSRGTGDLAGLNYFAFMDEEYINAYNESIKAAEEGTYGVEFDDEGYMYEYMHSLSLSNRKMYILASDYFTDMIRAFFIVPVSIALLQDVGANITGDRDGSGAFDIEDFYDQVEAGEWTYDLLAQYSEAIYSSSSSSSGGCSLFDDKVGFAISTNGLAASGFLYTSSVTIIERAFDDTTNDYTYSYPSDNNDLYSFCDAATALFSKSGVCVVGGKDDFESSWGDNNYEAIRNRFGGNHVLFGDIMLVGALEFPEYQELKDTGTGFGIVPVPVYREGDRYLTQIHNTGRPGAISAKTLKFVECTAFLNYQSTHSTEILDEYYNYKLQYDVAGGTEVYGTVEMLQYIRSNVRSAFDKCFEDSIAYYYSGEENTKKWHDMISEAKYQRTTMRGEYATIAESKDTYLDRLTEHYVQLDD